MAQRGTHFSASNGFDVINSRPSSILKKNSHTRSSVSCSINYQMPSNQNSVSANRLLSEQSSDQWTDFYSSLSAHRLRGHTFGSNHSRLTSSDSGVSCKYNHYSSSSTEDTNSSDNRENNSNGGNNTTNKRHMYLNNESVENCIMPSNYKCPATQANTPYNVDNTTDQTSFIQHQQLPGPLFSDGNDDRDSYPEYLISQSHSKVEEIRSSCHPSMHPEVDHNFDPQSSVSLVDDRRDTESHPPCTALQELSAVRRVTQTLTMIAKFATCNTWFTNKAIKTCLVIWIVFNITSLVSIGVLISMLLNQQTYQDCPLCKDIIDQAKILNGGHMQDSAIKEYLKENDKDGRCCLDHTFIFKLMAQSTSSPREPSQYKANIGETIIQIFRNSTAKAAIHLQSMPFNNQLSGSGRSETIRWNFKDNISVGMPWDNTYRDTEIRIPLSGVYYIYAMVQYVYMNINSTKHLESMQPVEDIPLSVSLYKMSASETIPNRIGTVTLHCRFASRSIEHNSIIQKIVQLTKGDKVSLVVSNWQFLNNKKNIHQIGLFKVD